MTGTGGLHSIQGRIYLPSGRTPETSITVKLQSTTFSTLSTDTDPGGAYMFGSLAPGSYVVVIDAGEMYEPAREYVVIDPEVKVEGMPAMVLPKIINLPVYLQFKRGAREPAAGVVNAKLANIPKEALKHYENGLKFSQTGKNDEALKEFRQAAMLYPEFAVAQTEIGKISLAAGKIDEAETAFRAALTGDAQQYEARLGLGIVLLNKKESVDAQKSLEEAKNMNQSAAAPAYYLGLLYFSQRKLIEAKNEFESAEKLKGDKDYPKAHFYLGGIYWGEKQYKKAADELEKYLAIDPNAKDADQTRKAIEQLRSKEN
jgi:tetratricopeptide (TPR) repeat protein